MCWRSLAHTNRKRARPPERDTTRANRSDSSPIALSSAHIRSMSSTTNTNCWPATAADTARVANATGASPALGWMPKDDRPEAKLWAGEARSSQASATMPWSRRYGIRPARTSEVLPTPGSP